MKIYSINYPSISFCGYSQEKNMNNKHVNFTNNPVQQGINTGGSWFAFGVGLDYISRKVSLFKSPMKNSLLLNGTIGVAAGVFTGYKVLNNKNHID